MGAGSNLNRQRFGDAPVPRRLLPQKIFRRDAVRKTARAHNLQLAWKLADKYRLRSALVAMGDRVENRFPDHSCIEGGNVANEKALLKVKSFVAKIDRRPDAVEHRKEALPVFTPLLVRQRCLAGTVFEDHFSLCQIAPQRGLCGKEDERRFQSDAIPRFEIGSKSYERLLRQGSWS